MIRAVLLLLMLASSALGATTVTLREVASVESSPVRLGDIASVEGDEAAALYGVEVLPGIPAGGVVRLDEVRSALDEAGVNWGRVALRGGECRLRRGALRLAPRASAAGADEDRFQEVALEGPETPRTRIAKLLAELYGVENADLRVRFDDGDARFLDGIPAGMRFDATIGTSAASEIAPVQVIVYDGDRVHEARTVRVEAQVRRDVLMLTRKVDRGERFETSALREMKRWIAPGGSPVVDEPLEAIGQLARTRLGAGTVVREAHLERPILIKRNELATVHCLSGSVSLRVQARAQDEGREGDVIEFRKSRRGEPFMARVTGAGFAVAISDTEAQR